MEGVVAYFKKRKKGTEVAVRGREDLRSDIVLNYYPFPCKNSTMFVQK